MGFYVCWAARFFELKKPQHYFLVLTAHRLSVTFSRARFRTGGATCAPQTLHRPSSSNPPHFCPDVLTSSSLTGRWSTISYGRPWTHWTNDVRVKNTEKASRAVLQNENPNPCLFPCFSLALTSRRLAVGTRRSGAARRYGQAGQMNRETLLLPDKSTASEMKSSAVENRDFICVMRCCCRCCQTRYRRRAPSCRCVRF